MPLSFQIGLAIGLLGCLSVFAMVRAGDRLARRYRLRKHSPSQSQSCAHPTGGRFIPVLLMLAGLLLSGCQTTQVGQIIDAISSASTNSPAITASNVTPNADGVIAAGTFVRPAIGFHKDIVTVLAEGPNMASVWRWTLKGGKWIGKMAVQGSDATAGRTYGAGIAADIGVFRFGPKGDHGTWKGPGLIMPDGRIIRTGLSTGVGRLAFDDKGLVLMGKNAEWARVNPDGTLGQRGQWKGLTTGEKLAFTTSGSTWACAMGGFSKQDASVGIGNASGCKVIKVAAFTNYPSMGPDQNWPAVAIDSTGTVWFASAYSGRLMVNAVTNGRTRWPTTALKDMGPCVTGDRCPPRLLTVRGLPWAIYEAPGKAIMLQAVPDGKPVRIATGSQPDATVGPDGIIRVVYVDAAALKFKEVKP